MASPRSYRPNNIAVSTLSNAGAQVEEVSLPALCIAYRHIISSHQLKHRAISVVTTEFATDCELMAPTYKK